MASTPLRVALAAFVVTLAGVMLACGSAGADGDGSGAPASGADPTERGEGSTDRPASASDGARDPRADAAPSADAAGGASGGDGGGADRTDGSASDAAQSDAGSSDAGVGDAAHADGGASDTGAGSLVANGTCTYFEIYRYLSCPTGMSCFCYDSPVRYFKDAPSHLDVAIKTGEVDVVGGAIPANKNMTTPAPAVVKLSASAGSATQTGSVYPYVVTVAAGQTTIKVSMNQGYRAESYIKYSSADCGYGGNQLDCTFRLP